MKKVLLTLFLIITLFVQLNPASCAGEWFIAHSDATADNAYAMLKAIDFDGEPLNEPGHDHETGEDHCQCPCHVNFQSTLSCLSATPAFLTSPYAEHRIYSFPDFPHDIYRPPHHL